MSSIAYIADDKMINYHRISGHRKINFWRQKTNRAFSNFTIGDFLFFLTKTPQEGDRKEKGIIGYGKLTDSRTLTIEKMWQEYHKMNGYDNIDDLKKAILKTTKEDKLPNEMNCLLLENVVYFNSPIYLSDIGMNISKNIESYIYLNHNDHAIASKIIQKARQQGVDLWASLIYGDDEDLILEENEVEIIITKAYETLLSIKHSPHDYKIIKEILKRYMMKNSFKYIKDCKTIIYHYQDNILQLGFALINNKQSSNKYKQTIGESILYKEFIEKNYDYPIKVEIILIDRYNNKVEL